MRKLGLLCTVLLGTSVVLAQADKTLNNISVEKSLNGASAVPARALHEDIASGDGVETIVVSSPMDFGGRYGDIFHPTAQLSDQFLLDVFALLHTSDCQF